MGRESIEGTKVSGESQIVSCMSIITVQYFPIIAHTDRTCSGRSVCLHQSCCILFAVAFNNDSSITIHSARRPRTGGRAEAALSYRKLPQLHKMLYAYYNL